MLALLYLNQIKNVNLMNYGEKIAYWYLRLNGFFLLNNFVTHRTQENAYASDIDLLGIRLPHVFEEVGGQDDDWHQQLMDVLDPTIPTGVLCEVKTGAFQNVDLFKAEYVQYAVDRFGFAPRLSEHIQDILNNRVHTFEINGTRFQILKVLVSNTPTNRGDLLQLDLQAARQFLKDRINKYKREKWQDRLLFDCDLLGNLIDEQQHAEAL